MKKCNNCYIRKENPYANSIAHQTNFIYSQLHKYNNEIVCLRTKNVLIVRV